MVIGLPQLLLEFIDFLFSFVDLKHLRVNIFGRNIRNERGSSRVVQSADVFLDELVAR